MYLLTCSALSTMRVVRSVLGFRFMVAKRKISCSVDASRVEGTPNSANKKLENIATREAWFEPWEFDGESVFSESSVYENEFHRDHLTPRYVSV